MVAKGLVAGAKKAISGTNEDSGFNFGLIGVMPLQNQFDVYGKLGLLRWETETDLVLNDATESRRDSHTSNGTDLYFGLGAKYNISKGTGVGLEWVRYNYEYDENVGIFGTNFNVESDNDTSVIGVTVFVNF